MRCPDDAGWISAEVSVHDSTPGKGLSAKTLLNASGKFVPGRINETIRPALRPDRIVVRPTPGRLPRQALPRARHHGDRNACSPSVSALNGISAAPIEKLVVFVVTPGVRISA